MPEVYETPSQVSSKKHKFCGRWGYFNKEKGVWVPFYCKGNRCKNPVCVEQRRARRIRIFDAMVVEHGMTRFFTLSLDPKKFMSREQAWEEVSHLWIKFRHRLAREYGGVRFVAVLEAQGNGYPHVHGLFNKYVDLRWIRKHWQEVGGGFQCDIELVREGEIGKYLSKGESMAKYLGKQYTDIAQYLDHGQRAFWRSKGLKVSFESKPEESEWELVKRNIFNESGNLLDIYAEGDIFNRDIVVEI